jgi:nitrate/nitrite transport system permease protein
MQSVTQTLGRLGERSKSTLLSVLIAVVFLTGWEALTQSSGAEAGASAYDQLVASDEQMAKIPSPSALLERSLELLADPFYDRGPNDKGIGLQLLFSIGRVAAGYFLALLVAIPLGFLTGMSPLMMRALNPFIQVLKPISPLAWMPLALFIIEDSILSSVFVIFICSLWPVLINTAFGVASVQKDWLNVGKTLELKPGRMALTVILPAAAPTILTGMRISIGISWLVIVAAEMLVGGTGIGYYVWNEWNNLDLASVIITIGAIGLVGMGLDAMLATVSRWVVYD